MRNKYLILTGLLLLMTTASLHAQQEAPFAFYMFNMPNFNPAMTGHEPEQGPLISVTSVMRLQQTSYNGAANYGVNNDGQSIDGFDESGPRVNTTNINGLLPGKVLGGRLGLGLTLMYDQTGQVGFTTPGLSASYSRSTRYGDFGIGINLEGYFLNLGQDWLPVDEQDPIVSALRDGGYNSITFNPNVGVNWWSKSNKYFASFSVRNLIEPSFGDISGETTSEFAAERHFYFMGGARYENVFMPGLTLMPHLKFRYAGAKSQIDLNAIAEYKKSFWGGLSVKTDLANNLQRLNDLSFMAGIIYKGKLRVGYAIDVPTNGDQISNFGVSHEIMVNYRFSLAVIKTGRVPKTDSIRIPNPDR